MTELRIETTVLPGSQLGPQNPLPFFRDQNVDRTVTIDESMPDEKRKYFGWQAGQRVLPYRMQDQYNRQRSDYPMKVAVLENDFLKATFWLELGGRLMSLIYKPLGRDLVYTNQAFQPANFALRNAWFSGGIEWNVGHVGHSFLTCEPIYAAVIQNAQGEPGLRLYEFERCKCFLWQTDFYLPADSEFLVAYTRVINTQDKASSMYWWTNMGVAELPGTRVLAPADEAIYIFQKFTGYGFSNLPDLPSLPGKDPTYSLNWPNANEFFFQCDQADIPWVAALDASGAGLIEASTPRLKYRKMFCFGTNQGGQHWQEYLLGPSESYLEIQAGLAPTQLHHLPFAAQEEWDWTEVFGYIQADSGKVHDPNYQAAWRAVDAVLKTRLNAADLNRIETECRANADQPPTQILQMGSGWGALEMARRNKNSDSEPFPKAFVFPPDSMGVEQARWVSLLENGYLPCQSPDQLPGEWLVQSSWQGILAANLDDKKNQHWFAWLHYGVMLAEAFDYAAAEIAWRKSLAFEPSAWAYRNLAVIFQTNHRLDDALEHYKSAWQLAKQQDLPLEPFAHEYLELYIQARQYRSGWEFITCLPANVADSERIQISRAIIALELNELNVVEEVLSREFANIREGQVDLSNIWLEMWRHRIAEKRGCDLGTISLAEVKEIYPIPRSIDFRSTE
jgi:hypothetical protein